MTWYTVIVNENMHDACAFMLRDDGDNAYTPHGWERVWSAHEAEEEAFAELAKAKEYVKGRMLP